jgi:hypothetical protein
VDRQVCESQEREISELKQEAEDLVVELQSATEQVMKKSP